MEVIGALLGEGEGKVGGMKPPGSLEMVAIFGSIDTFSYERNSIIDCHMNSSMKIQIDMMSTGDVACRKSRASNNSQIKKVPLSCELQRPSPRQENTPF